MIARRIQLVLEAWEMRIRLQLHWIPWHDHWIWPHEHGSWQDCRRRQLAEASQPLRYSRISGFRQLLPTIHQELLGQGASTQRSHKERHTLALENQWRSSICYTQASLHQSIGAGSLRSELSNRSRSRRFQLYHWWHAFAERRRRLVASSSIPIRNNERAQTQLRDLR